MNLKYQNGGKVIQKLYQKLITQIKNYIKENQLREGNKLPTETEMCATFGVSRAILREALKALQFMGVLSPSPGIGYVVNSFNYDSVLENLMYYLADDSITLLNDMLVIRKSMECFFFNQAYDSLTEGDIQELYDACCYMKESIGDSAIYTLADMKFHMTLFKHIENILFKSLLNTAWHAENSIKNETQQDYEDINQTTEDHHRIYLAILNKKRDEARELLDNHFNVQKFSRPFNVKNAEDKT